MLDWINAAIVVFMSSVLPRQFIQIGPARSLLADIHHAARLIQRPALSGFDDAQTRLWGSLAYSGLFVVDASC